MKITPIDIAHKVFAKKMFGLDESEVQDYLQTISVQMEALIIERNSLKEANRSKDLTIAELREKDQVLQSTISTAAQMADRIRADAEREAKLITMEAHNKAEEIARDARESLRKLYVEMTDMKKARMQFQANLRALAQAHIDLIQQGEGFMPAIGLPNMDLENGSTATQSTVAATGAASNVTSRISPLATK